MTGRSFYEADSKLLTADAFQFVLDSELKRAVRSQSSLALVLLQIQPVHGASTTGADDLVPEVAQVISRDVRDTDLLGHTAEGTLTLLLLDTDFERSARVTDRLASHIESHNFSTVLKITVGVACYPTHAVDGVALKRHAADQSIGTWRSATPSA
jgi:PleD family two-component response regulator